MKKYQLANRLNRKYRKLARVRYFEFGCNDRKYKEYCKIVNFVSYVLQVNNWDNTINLKRY